MSLKQWYTVLLENKVLMNNETPAALLPIRPEVLHPTTDWPQVWLISRTKGLGSELVSFQLKMLHGLLPTQERIARVGLHEGQPGLCLLCRLDTEDLVHTFFDCNKNMLVGLALLGCVQQLVPDLSPEAAVRVDFGCLLQEDQNLAVQIILITSLKYIWESRLAKKMVSMFRMRAEIEARVAILNQARHQSSAEIITDLISILN